VFLFDQENTESGLVAGSKAAYRCKISTEQLQSPEMMVELDEGGEPMPTPMQTPE